MNALLVLPLLLAPEAPPADGEVPGGAISYEIRLVDCETLGWRKEFQSRLRFGGHRAGSSAWIADESTLGEMVVAFMTGKDARVVAAPKVVATSGDPAVVGTSTTRHFVVHAEPEPGPAAEGDGGPMPPRPVVAPVDDGSQIRVAGLPGPEGMHLKVQVVDCRVGSVHVIEAVDEGGASFKVQVPEVIRREMAGEWVLPEHHSLVLSLGVESAADDDGKATARERLLLISTRQIGDPPASPASDPGVRLTEGTSAPTPTPGMPTPTPAIPAPVVAPTHAPIPIGEVSAPIEPPIALPISGVAAPRPQTTPPAAPTSGVAFQPTGPISALADTPWGLLPIVPVEVIAAEPAEAEAPVEVVAMPLPTLPSRNLPTAIDADGRSIDPRTEKDRQAERTDYAPFVDGKPVPSPQVTLPSTAETAGDDALRTTSAEAASAGPKADRSMIKVRFSLNLARGFEVDVDLGPTPPAAEQQADAVEPPVRR